MTDPISVIAVLVVNSALVWNVHRMLNNKGNKLGSRLDKRVDRVEDRAAKTEEKIVFTDVFEGFKETAEAKHEALEDMQSMLKESLREGSKVNGKDHERLMNGISDQSKQIAELPALIQTTIQNTLKTG